MTPAEVVAAREAGESLVVLDVRQPEELALASVPNVLHIPMMTIPERLGELDRSGRIAVLCHHGQRSANVCAYLKAQGFTDVHNIDGGIDAWARDLDASIGLY